MIRKVKFPLKYKFVVAISVLLLLTMGFYLSYALNIFKEDKAADVYSITLTNSISVAERTKLLINEDIQFLSGLKESTDGENIQKKMEDIAASRDEILGIECLVNNENYLSAKNNKKLDELTNGASELLLSEVTGVIALLKNLPLGVMKVEISPVKNFPSHFSLIKSLNQNLVCALHISYEKLMPLMNETLNYGTYILTENGKSFFKLNNFNLPKDLKKIVSDPTIQDVEQGVKKFDDNGVAVIRAFSKVSGFGLIAITEIEENKAFMASSLLIQKSLYFGILILSIAVIVGILFTKRMTRNVQTLFEATTLLSQGNFNVNPVAKGNDEIGALTDSFVDMKDKIVMFMEEMKEKARIEGELKVAQLVQNSFFPKHAVLKSTFGFDGRYMPASECSGDWWGYFEQGSKVSIIVCDATGHGVPAALITAAAHSCISTIKIDSEKNYINPSSVLEKLNKVVCSMNSEILMTAFVIEIDEEKNQITYSNASHMTPYLIHRLEGSYTKDGVDPLIGNNGPRVGEKMDSQYFETIMPIIKGDRVVMFSDGLTEMEVDGKSWGQRNFLKSVLKGCTKESTGLLKSILEDFAEHRKKIHLQDDITLVCISFEGERIVIDDSNAQINDGSMYAISKLSNEENIDLLSRAQVNHLVGFNTIDLANEIKLVEILESKKTFIFEDYVNENYKKMSWTLTSNLKIGEVLNNMNSHFNEDLTEAIKPETLKLVGEELLSNAFYHSGGNGVQKERGKEVQLPTGKQVELLMATNSDYVVISVKGPTGFSSKEKILSSIKRGYKEKSPLDGKTGAGLGLYMVYEHSNQFWVVNGGEFSGQMICVFEKFNRYKKARERVTSFHYLTKEIES
ncbi:MAG: SpoIIE family protein phosphatase [Bdellovibrionales bacterium]|nr:SpoIIE family protein phosphatase [Bdellovibrionales bacterium]